MEVLVVVDDEVVVGNVLVVVDDEVVVGRVLVVVDDEVVVGNVLVVVDDEVVVGRVLVVVDDEVVVGRVVVVDDVVVVGAQTGLVMTLESKVTAPLRASSRPCTTAFVVAVMEVKARIVPMNVEPTPRTEELPTCQKTLHAWAPFTRATTLLGAVMSVDPAWNTQTASGSPWASRVSVPVIANDVGVVYTPGASVCPPRSVGPP